MVSMRCNERMEEERNHAEPSQVTTAELESIVDSGERGKHGENSARSASGDIEAEDDATSAVSWASVEDMVAAESGAERLSSDRKDDHHAACKGSQAEQKPSLKGTYTAEANTKLRGMWWDKKGDDGPHGRDVLQNSYIKHLRSSAKQEKSVKVPQVDAPKHLEAFIYSRQQPQSESAQQHGGASQQHSWEGAQHWTSMVKGGECRAERQDSGSCYEN
ncbi:hypothetical protein HPB51_006340 [Rhipicephalus microplus]|uniref:Uncharacterized protein n=1 Tax=Rhipicephalus microplus TaxID=6941 RepID=A0A9J6ES20_RHIMP|nr:hypothetical protein HPB51_006340 [Rhipicephalus microplus]